MNKEPMQQALKYSKLAMLEIEMALGRESGARLKTHISDAIYRLEEAAEILTQMNNEQVFVVSFS